MGKRIAAVIGVGLLLLASYWIMLDHYIPQSHVEAQGFEPFSKTFTLPYSTQTQIIPPCTTGSTNCIPNFKQISQTVNYSFSSQPGGNLLANCGILLDGSNDNVTFQTLAASGNAWGQQNGSFSANAYYPFRRIKYPNCSSFTSGILTIIYIGFSSEIPISLFPVNMANRYAAAPSSIASPVTVDPVWSTPGVLTGFQCSNPDTSHNAWLQLFVANSQPTLGVGVVYGLLVPEAQTVTYTGLPLSYYALSAGGSGNRLWAGAATTAGTGQVLTFNATPTAGGSGYVQADVGALLTLACGATVAITQVNSGSGTGPVTAIATTPTFGGFGCVTGTGQTTTGGTGSGATVNVTSTAGGSAVSTPIWCNVETNGTGPYYPFNPLSP